MKINDPIDIIQDGQNGFRTSISVIMAFWLFLVAVSLGLNLYHVNKENKRVALQTARAFFSQIVLTREWNALHGGVYVAVTGQTRPNPYLRVPRRDIVVDKGLTLTMINPAFMTRQLSELAEKKEGIRFHLTSLKPIRPLNAPDAWEREALLSFEKGNKERGEFLRANDRKSFVYMAPLVTEAPCLKCHAEQGYKEGDIRGGIRITLPLSDRLHLQPLVAAHLGLGFCGVVIILLFGKKLQKAYDTLRIQSIIDGLTGIPNHRFFTERLYLEFHRSRRHLIRDASPQSLPG